MDPARSGAAAPSPLEMLCLAATDAMDLAAAVAAPGAEAEAEPVVALLPSPEPMAAPSLLPPCDLKCSCGFNGVSNERRKPGHKAGRIPGVVWKQVLACGGTPSCSCGAARRRSPAFPRCEDAAAWIQGAVMKFYNEHIDAVGLDRALELAYTARPGASPARSDVPACVCLRYKGGVVMRDARGVSVRLGYIEHIAPSTRRCASTFRGVLRLPTGESRKLTKHRAVDTHRPLEEKLLTTRCACSPTEEAVRHTAMHIAVDKCMEDLANGAGKYSVIDSLTGSAVWDVSAAAGPDDPSSLPDFPIC